VLGVGTAPPRPRPPAAPHPPAGNRRDASLAPRCGQLTRDPPIRASDRSPLGPGRPAWSTLVDTPSEARGSCWYRGWPSRRSAARFRSPPAPIAHGTRRTSTSARPSSPGHPPGVGRLAGRPDSGPGSRSSHHHAGPPDTTAQPATGHHPQTQARTRPRDRRWPVAGHDARAGQDAPGQRRRRPPALAAVARAGRDLLWRRRAWPVPAGRPSGRRQRL
jgi:hypothetical protein